VVCNVSEKECVVMAMTELATKREKKANEQLFKKPMSSDTNQMLTLWQ
jgi:hypothetical protein